jgi:S-adenosyl-L-methionine hydrolase (adenosine-forming)
VSAPVISFTTDYGLRDGFVGVCRGVIARGCPEAQVIDLSHEVSPHDVHSGALVLASSIDYLPDGAVHLAVVDPGVGTARRAIAVLSRSGARFVGPDNGLLEPAVAASGGAAEVVDIARSRFALTGVSATFHGRDVFAPVAAALAAGRGLSEVGSEVEPSSLVVLERTRASRQDRALVAHVQYIDQFGNLQLDGDAQDIAWVTAAGPVAVVSSAWDRPPLAVSHGTTFADVSTGELVLYEDAHRRPAIAVNRGSAAERLGLGVGDELQIAPMDVAASD